MEKQSILKNRLKLKRLSIQVEDAVDENFGYSPSYPWFHELLEKKWSILTEARKNDSDWITHVFEIFEYKENCKNLPIF